MTTAIQTDDLTRGFPSGLAVDGLSLEVPAGEVLALLGHNGAGKTTTVRLLNGILRPERGGSRVLGLDPVADGDAVRSRTGVLTETAGLDDRLTSVENLEITARIRGFDRREATRRSLELLERFGMAGRAHERTRGFSTGERKRVALARALLHDPEVLFLDEPTSGLDPAGTRDVVDLVGSLASGGRTIVLATHFLGEAGRLADRMAVLHAGRLEALGAPSALAAELIEGIGATIDLGSAAPAASLELLRSRPGVLSAESAPDGAVVRVDDRDAIPALVRALVAEELAVYEVRVQVPTLEDVYFAVQRRLAAAEPGVSDAFLTSARPGATDPAEVGR